MFEYFRQLMERDAALKASEQIPKAHYFREISITHYSLALLVGFISFIILLISCYSADTYTEYGNIIYLVSIIFIIILLVCSEFLKRQITFLNKLINLKRKLGSYIINKKKDDFFYVHFYLTIGLIYLPIIITIVIVYLLHPPWNEIEPNLSDPTIDSLKHLIPFSAAIIAAQIALFTFMLGQLLTKYSSSIAMTIIKHRAIIALWIYSILSLFVTYYCLFYGYPSILKNILVPLIFMLNIFCLAITITIANTGIQTDKAFIYVGVSFSKRIKRVFKPSILQADGKPSRFWRALGFLGLDWRDPERLILFAPPYKGIAITISSLRSLFNAANKAIEENQQELLLAILTAILGITETYTKIRSSYYGSEDEVYSFLNNQMVPLLKNASKSPNEYMITDLVKVSGALGIRSLDIGNLPGLKGDEDKQPGFSKSHHLSTFWINLLVEAFELCFSLMRSTAPSEAIQQLQNIAIVAYQKGYSDVIPVSYIPAINKIHKNCLLLPDVYHLLLASNCLQKTIKVWAYAAITIRGSGGVFDINEQLGETILELAKNQFTVEKLPSLMFSDVFTVLSSKIKMDELIIQDIFVITLYRPFSKQWEPRATIEDLTRIITIVTGLAKEAVNQKISSPSHYIEVLYELSYLILRGLPDQYLLIKKKNGGELSDDDDLFRKIRKPWQDVMEEKLFESWNKLFPLFFKTEEHVGLDWQQQFFGILGIGMVVYEERKSELLKEQLLKCAMLYHQLILQEDADPDKRVYEDAWNYLQLLGSWVKYFLKEDNSATQIAILVGAGRPFRDGFYGGSSGKYGHLGYPGIMHEDFFLPWLRNLQPQGYLSEGDWEKFRSWQNKLMCDDVLMPFYDLVEETRKPLREKFYEEMRETRRKKTGKEWMKD